MIYGAQQTIKLIRLCVFPEEGPAGGCSRPSPAPSLFEPPLPSVSLPSELLERLSVCVFLSHCAHKLLQLTCEGCCACLSWTLLCALRHWPDHQQGAKTIGGAPHNGPLSAGLWLAATLHPHFSFSEPPTWGVREGVAPGLVSVPIASPAVQSDILHAVCARQVLSRESGASKRSGDCEGLENPYWRAKLLLENFK